RRIREDFGIEIELDTGPLMPGPGGYASQHAVIGTIHYDGAEGADKGTILYFKPVLVGEEPSDVQEYHDVNPKFPHESTGDQFYDEAQWESYRRLGEHSANMVFRFLLEHSPGDQQDFVDRLFLDVIERWQRPRAIDTARLRQLVERRDALIADVREHAPLSLQAELLPLLSLSFGITPAPESQTDRVQSLFFCLRMAALREEVWEAAALDTHWSHPTNQGWMSFYHSCASTASFRAC